MFKGLHTTLQKTKRVNPNQHQSIVALQTGVNLLVPEKRQQYLKNIKSLLNLPPKLYDHLYYKPIQRFAEFVQTLPETHHGLFSESGGLLDHALERASRALSILLAYFFAQEKNFQNISSQDALWVYAVFTAALLLDIGKIAVKYKITICHKDGEPLKEWLPFTGSMLQEGKYYKFEYAKENRDHLRQLVTPLLARQLLQEFNAGEKSEAAIVGNSGFNWIASNPDVLEAWLMLLNGESRSVSPYLTVIPIADAQVIDNHLVIRAPFQPAKEMAEALDNSIPPEIEAFLRWLRENLANNAFSINQPNSNIHLVPEGVLINPALFQKFIDANPHRQISGGLEQKFRQILETFLMPPSVLGTRYSRIGGIATANMERYLLITNPALLFTSGRLPPLAAVQLATPGVADFQQKENRNKQIYATLLHR